jgi:ATP-dependent Clp protease adaptor protein ClpS
MSSQHPSQPTPSQPTGPLPAPRPQGDAAPKQQNKQPWLWHVVLLDDDEHTETYVIRMMQDLFNMNGEKATHVADMVDAHGRTVVFTAHKELAELKRDQILGYGRDPHVSECKGSMGAVIEPTREDEGQG